jgi:hypothetical protein
VPLHLHVASLAVNVRRMCMVCPRSRDADAHVTQGGRAFPQASIAHLSSTEDLTGDASVSHSESSLTRTRSADDLANVLYVPCVENRGRALVYRQAGDTRILA